jgi:putative acetyltransferase
VWTGVPLHDVGVEIIEVRPEDPADFDEIDEVVREAFGSDEEVHLVRAIRRSPGYIPGLALVAVSAGHVVGHVMVSHASLTGNGYEHRVATLSPLAVAPEWQRRGVGSRLVREVSRLAEAHGEPAVVLEGSPSYYARFGFEPCDPFGVHIDLPTWARPEAAQILRLSRWNAGLCGRLVFPALDEIRRQSDA